MLLTKFFLPELRPDRVDRLRLIDRMKRASQNNLVIISAPAGCGKTTLVSAWVRAEGFNTAWISLDESDNDPVMFWSGLLTAMEMLFPGTGKNSQSMLATKQLPPAQVLLVNLLNDLVLQSRTDESDPSPACLVLDDTHRVTNPAIYEGLLFFIERLPGYLRLVLVGRSDPPLPLGRLRASCRMLEVRAADLRFTLDECEDFLKRVMGLDLPQDQVKRLEERTEGWIAGLQLAGLAMQALTREPGPGNLGDFIETFSGDDRFILDYLLEEVLNRLPQSARTFLLQTSILERMCGPLCDALTGLPQGESQALLERFERENLFLVPLDNRRVWYRYHHLFSDLLRHQLERQGGEKAKTAAADLHRRAAEWLAGQGYVPDAIGHALQGHAFEQAAGLIEGYAWNGIDRGEYTTLRRWLEALPQAVIAAKPELLMHYAWTLAYLGDVDQYERPLSAAEQLWRAQGNQARLGEALNLRADFAATYGDGEKAAALAQEALSLLPEDDLYHRGMSWMYLGCGAFLQGNMEVASQAFSRGRALCEQSGNTTGIRMSSNVLVQVHQAQGNLPAAAKSAEETLSQTGGLAVYEGLVARALLGTIWREWNRLDEAEQALQSVLELVEKTGQDIYFSSYYLILALIQWEKGDWPGMERAFEQQARLADQMNDSTGRELGQVLRAQMFALSGDLEPLLAWRAGCQLSAEDPITYQNEVFYLALARLLVRWDHNAVQEGLVLLDKLQSIAQGQQRFGSLIEILLLKALGLAALNDITGACTALEESLTLAQPSGYQRLFIDEGQPFFDLLSVLLRKPSLSLELRAYAAQLQKGAPDLAQPTSAARMQTANQTLIEPLTPREIEVLHLIRSGLSNREIAQQLYLTLNTVKVHAKNIFAKLGVESRTQAVRRAEELDLI